MELEGDPARHPGAAGVVFDGHFDGASPPAAVPRDAAAARLRLVCQGPRQLFRCAGWGARTPVERGFLAVGSTDRQPKTPAELDAAFCRLVVLCAVNG